MAQFQFLMRHIVVFSILLCVFSTSLAETQNQSSDGVNITSNNGQSCNRKCDGKPMLCYYKFNVTKHFAMSRHCGACANGKISDCFRAGCVTANGIQRSIMTVNQQMPGPRISVCRNDRIIVDVKNGMDNEELSIHWHGLKQNNTPWFDGVPMVTQCPILTGQTFRYDFIAHDVGSHYCHAQSGLHQSNGLVGLLDVRDQDDPNADHYDYDLEEHSIILTDWTNESSDKKEANSKLTVPDTILINGFGQHFNQSVGNYTYAPVAVFYVERSKNHRFRIHNAASLSCPLEISIQAINMSVIATDGNPIIPIVVDNFISSSVERFDVVVHAFNFQEIKEVLMSVRGLLACKEKRLNGFAKIIFVDDLSNFTAKFEDHEPPRERPNYDPPDAPRITLNHPHSECSNSDDICITALQSIPIVGSNDEDLRNESATTIPLEIRHGSINNITFKSPPKPGLTEDDSNVQYCNMNSLPDQCNGNTICYCTHLINLDLGKVYEFHLINNERSDGLINYPIHLHGFKFQVVEMGSNVRLRSDQITITNSTSLPVLKDTVVVPSGGFIKFRFRSNNPGYWYFRSLFDFDEYSGMAAIIKVGKRTDMPSPPANFPKC